MLASLGSFLFHPLVPCFLIPAGGAKRHTPDAPQLLSFRKQFRFDGDSDVAHVLEPANGFVYFLDHSAELRDEFGRPLFAAQ